MTLIEQALARIAEMEKRAEKATPGPWDSQGIDIFTTDKRASVRIPWEGHIGEFGGGRSPEEGSRNAAFTCAARTDLPALCALVKAFIGQVPFDEALRKEELAALKSFVEAK